VKNFRTLDLNLLRVFDAVMTQGSVTHAAEMLALTQPAASHALKRLNAWLGEPLFQRSAAGMTPSARAAALWPQVRAALQDLERALAPGAFDPLRDAAEFRLSLSDASAGALVPALVAALEREAARVDLRIQPLTTRDPRALLHAEEADLAIGFFPTLVSAMLSEGERSLLRHARLHQTPYVCVMRPQNPLAEGDLTLERYVQARHVLVSVSGQAHAEIDEALALRGSRRRILLTVNQYDLAGRVVLQSDLLTVLPHSFVAGSVPGPVVVRPLPLAIGPLTVDMVWLARRDNDPAHQWLREQVQRAGVFG
jgi:DNA-binding transcriptional LysR family regulator